MNLALELLIFALCGFLGLAGTRPLVAKMPRAWRWSWSVLLLLLYSVSHGLLETYWSDYHGAYGFFTFLGGAIVASVLYAKSWPHAREGMK